MEQEKIQTGSLLVYRKREDIKNPETESDWTLIYTLTHITIIKGRSLPFQETGDIQRLTLFYSVPYSASSIRLRCAAQELVVVVLLA